MKKTITLLSLLSAVGMVLIDSSGNLAISNGAGAPSGHTNSPADGMTCSMSTCHGGTATPSATQIISSNVPVNGYSPGQTYTITASVSQAGINKFGFQISPQRLNGQLSGTLAITNATATKIVGTKYVTHTSSGTAGSANARTWTFNWTAPSTGSGNVTFYGAFLFANGNNASSGDIVRTNTLVIPENTTGLAEIQDLQNVQVYPNPVTEKLNIQIYLTKSSQVSLSLIDLTGREVIAKLNTEGTAGVNSYQIDIPSKTPTGVYQLLILTEEGKSIQKILKK